MKHLKSTFVITALLFGLFIVPSVNAKSAIARIATNAQGQTCKMVKTATLSVNFSNVPTELKTSKSFVQEKADEIIALAADLGMEDIHVQNMNYSIYSNSSGCNTSTPSTYQLNGSISFQSADPEKVEQLMGIVGEKGYKVNFNMNAYRQCQ